MKTKKRKALALMMTTVLLFGIGTVSYARGGGGGFFGEFGKRITAVIDILFNGTGPDPIPCWSAGNIPDGCTGTYVECAPCIVVNGDPRGGQGECIPGR